MDRKNAASCGEVCSLVKSRRNSAAAASLVSIRQARSFAASRLSSCSRHQRKGLDHPPADRGPVGDRQRGSPLAPRIGSRPRGGDEQRECSRDLPCQRHVETILEAVGWEHADGGRVGRRDSRRGRSFSRLPAAVSPAEGRKHSEHGKPIDHRTQPRGPESSGLVVDRARAGTVSEGA